MVNKLARERSGGQLRASAHPLRPSKSPILLSERLKAGPDLVLAQDVDPLFEGLLLSLGRWTAGFAEPGPNKALAAALELGQAVLEHDAQKRPARVGVVDGDVELLGPGGQEVVQASLRSRLQGRRPFVGTCGLA